MTASVAGMARETWAGACGRVVLSSARAAPIREAGYPRRLRPAAREMGRTARIGLDS